MPRQRSAYPLDESPAMPGDDGFSGVGLARSPEQLAPRLAAFARNLRFRGNVASTRRGVDKCLWGVRTGAYAGVNYSIPWADAHAVDRFTDPNGLEWILIAAEDRIWRIRVNNTPVALPQPDGVWCAAPLTCVQAFGQLYCLRGNHRRTLVMDSIESGWRYLWPTWDATTDWGTDATVMWGPWIPELAGTLTLDGPWANLQTAAVHGLQNGSEISIRSGTLPSVLQGTFKVSVLDSRTVRFHHAGTGFEDAAQALEWTIHKRAWKVATGQNPTPGQEPGVHASWVRDYTVLPNGLNGAYINGRLLVPTSWIPGAASTDPADYSAKSDYLAVSDVSNRGRFTIANEFRINQGSSDELRAVVRGGPRDVVCFKGSTIHLLRNFGGDLTSLSLDTLSSTYGLANSRAWTQVGRDLVFLAPGRGICTLSQSATGEVQGVDVPLSHPVQPLIDRIHWRMADGVRMAFWENKLYVALPIDDGSSLGASQIVPFERPKFDALSVSFWLIAGQEYEWQPGEDQMDALEVNGELMVPADGPRRFVYGGGAAFLRYLGEPNPDELYVTQARIRPVRRGNNVVLVYDYELPVSAGDDPAWRAFHPAGQWSGYDDGIDLSVREFLVATVHGRERLLALTADGYLSMIEASDDGDYSRPAAPILNREIQEPIVSEMITRGYRINPGDLARGLRVAVGLGTWSPRYSLTVRSDGVAEERLLRDGVTKDRTKVTRPAWAKAFNPFAKGARHDDPWRADYSVVPDIGVSADVVELTADSEIITADAGGAGIDVGPSGIVADRLQESLDRVRVPSLPGKWLQFRFINRQGRVEVRSTVAEIITAARADAIKS